jgi:sRNA-binding protein
VCGFHIHSYVNRESAFVRGGGGLHLKTGIGDFATARGRRWKERKKERQTQKKKKKKKKKEKKTENEKKKKKRERERPSRMSPAFNSLTIVNILVISPGAH